jgi:hypothetical protein
MIILILEKHCVDSGGSIIGELFIYDEDHHSYVWWIEGLLNLFRKNKEDEKGNLLQL